MAAKETALARFATVLPSLESINRRRLENLGRVAQDHGPDLRLALGPQLWRLWSFLRAEALTRNPDAHRKAELTFMAPVPAVALAIGVSEAQVWKLLAGTYPALKPGQHALFSRLVANRAHVADVDTTRTHHLNGKPLARSKMGMNAGTVFTVRCVPVREGFRVRVRLDSLTHAWRDLGAHIKAGLTVNKILRSGKSDLPKLSDTPITGSKNTTEEGCGLLSLIYQSSLTAFSTSSEGVSNDPVKPRSVQVFEVEDALFSSPGRGMAERAEWADRLAGVLEAVMPRDRGLRGHAGWRNLYRRYAWVILKLEVNRHTLEANRARALIWDALFGVLVRESDNPTIRRPGALIAWTLAQSEEWINLEKLSDTLHAGRRAA